MLPQLRKGLQPRSLTNSYTLIVPSTVRGQAVTGYVNVSGSGSHYPRTCFGWHRKYDRNDPRFQRLRHRIVRARLIQSLYNKSPHISSLRSIGWRLSSSLGRTTQADDTGSETTKTNKNSTGRPEDESPFELSEKEKHWKQRIDYIKRWIDEDPYEAMFGWSNRLRKGQSLRGWPFGNIPAWWQEEMSLAKDKISNETGDKPKPEKAEAPRVKSEVEVEKKEAEPMVQTSVERTSPQRIMIRRSIDEPPLEYDPISNRMIRKGDQAFSHYAQELDVDEASAKPPRPSIYPRKIPIEVIGERPKPSKTAIEPKDPRKGSLTPYKSSSPNARAEYEAYKAQRLGELQIQETEETIEEGRQAVEATQQAQAEAAKRRAKLEEDFEKAHQMTENCLPSLTPFKIQRSKGTVLEPSGATIDSEDGSSDSTQLHSNAMPMHQHRKILLMQLDDVDAQDNRVKQQISALQKRIDPADKDVGILEQKLENLWMKRKALEKQRAELNEILREVRWTKPQDHQSTLDYHKSENIQISTDLETALQRHSKEKAFSPSADHPTEDPTFSSEHSSQPDLEPKSTQNETENWLDKVKRAFIVSDQSKEPIAEDVYKQKKEEAAKSMLDEEVNQQKLAMSKMKNIPKKPLASVIALDSSSLPDPDSIQKRAAEAVAIKEQKARDAELVREIRSAYEGEYGPITTQHRQIKEFKVETDNADSEDALKTDTVTPTSEHITAGLRTEEPSSDFSQPTAPKKVEIGPEIPSIPSTPSVSTTIEATESKMNAERLPSSTLSSIAQEPCAESISDIQAESITTETPKPITESDPTDVNAITTSYAFLAYDHTTASVTRATVAAPPNSTETPMPLTVALTQLTHPAKFLPYLPSLKERGFVPVSCSNNLLILRRTGPPEQRPKTMRSQESGNEKLVNPIDKTGTGAAGGAHVPTGNFASPTGFVNYEVPDEHLSSSAHYHHHHHHPIREHRHNGKQHEHHIRNGHHRPRRLETVFSGGSRVQKPWDRKRERRKWKRWAKNIAASFGIAVAIIYIAGLIAEMRKETRKVIVTTRNDDAS